MLDRVLFEETCLLAFTPQIDLAEAYTNHDIGDY